jgi:hypothetical protein
MQIQHLVYCGKREEGILKVVRVDVLSPWRNIKYYKGLRFQVGKAVPLDIANVIAKDYPSVFEITTEELGDKEAYGLQLSDILEECLAVVGDEEALKVINKVVEKHFEGCNVKKKLRRRKK